ncbi:hypothetical protein QWJ26_24490 [Streptomyces sp. CSDS2]|uniref:hypothetical protein n=1 Tax=Streptomyces sp. CSDS2 TaxID=3055051 RepID=UPI0025B23A2C|nr:hypothetical protein [Streptomyces sp. CSDS2]MDN3262908.1 hypothetical protein [Streptomyces sp. CSDS2]
MPTIKDAREAKKHEHWLERQRRQVELRGDAGLVDAWWDRVRSICKTRAEQGDPEPWRDLARTLENWVHRHSSGDRA